MFQALKNQQRVISALIFRETKTRFGEARLGGFWLILEPCFHLITLMALWYVIGHLAPMTVNPYLFLLTGIFPYIFLRTCTGRIRKVVQANKALLIFPQIKLLDFITARLIIEIVVMLCSSLLLISVLVYTGLAEVEIKDSFNLIMSLFLLVYSALSFGVFALAITTIYPVFEKFLDVIFRILYFTSGIMYSIYSLPAVFQKYIIYNPLFQIINLIRHSFFKDISYDKSYLNYEYVLLLFSLMFVTGIYLIKKYKKYLLQEND